MTAFDDVFVPLAISMLDEFGADCVLSYDEGGVSDPTTGSVTGGAPVTEDTKMTPPTPIAEKYIDGVTVKRGDMKAILADGELVTTPRPGMSVIFKGVTWTAEEANPLYSGEQIAIWKLRLRK